MEQVFNRLIKLSQKHDKDLNGLVFCFQKSLNENCR